MRETLYGKSILINSESQDSESKFADYVRNLNATPAHEEVVTFESYFASSSTLLDFTKVCLAGVAVK